MPLISIQPFAFRKIFLLVVALLGLSSAACFADSLFMSLHSTSYRGLMEMRSTAVSRANGSSLKITNCRRESWLLNAPEVQRVTDDRFPVKHVGCESFRLEDHALSVCDQAVGLIVF